MTAFRKSAAVTFLNGMVQLFVYGFLIYLAFIFLIFIVTVIDPEKTQKFAQTNNLFHLIPKREMPEIAILSKNPKFDIRINSIMGYLNFETSSRIYHVLTFVPHMIWWGLYLVIFFKLKGFFITLKRGDPFVYENAGRIRTVGVIVLICELLRVVKDFSIVFYLKGMVTSPSFDVSTLPFEFYLEYLRLDLIFIGLVVLVFSEIFRIGSIMREEQRLTI